MQGGSSEDKEMGGTIFGFPRYPPFQYGKERFPQDTFLGRWLHFNDVIDPRTLFTNDESYFLKMNVLMKNPGWILDLHACNKPYSIHNLLSGHFKKFQTGQCPTKRLNECIRLLEDYKNNNIPANITNRDLWDAQKIKQAIIHPDTGEKIFMPFRMSGFVPFGSPIVTGLLLPNPTLFQTVFWQWLNQSHNACVNYANRNASKPTPISRFMQGYAGAVTTAVSIAVGLSLLIKRAENFKPATKVLVQKFIPFPAVAFASTCNAVLMRRHEIGTGIQVLDSRDQVIGTSKVAAKRAVKETAMTRAFLPAPILLIPPIVMTFLEKTKFLKRNPRWHLPLNALTCTLSFGFALPVAIALFPQRSKIAVKDLEPQIAQSTNEEFLYYNKGL